MCGCTPAALTAPPPPWSMPQLRRAGVIMSVRGLMFDHPIRATAHGRGPRMRALVAFILAVTTAAPAAAEWPDRPVRLVVPFAAGGAADVIARLFADNLSVVFSQQFVVENRAGAGGIVGAQTVARADPDGYTLMGAGMSSHVLSPAT